MWAEIPMFRTLRRSSIAVAPMLRRARRPPRRGTDGSRGRPGGPAGGPGRPVAEKGLDSTPVLLYDDGGDRFGVTVVRIRIGHGRDVVRAEGPGWRRDARCRDTARAVQGRRPARDRRHGGS